jgi:16S rRNA (adenine1518-N6/adenine1519-N6)-dimethyltransferase
LLTNEYKSKKNFKLICSDYLDINLDKLIKDEFNNEEVIVISNLPYYITSKIIFKNLESTKITKQILMVQKEYGDRAISVPGTKKFGRLSVGVQIFNDVSKVTNVSRNSFAPRPNVDSIVIELKRKEKQLLSKSDSMEFLNMVKVLFANKRKTIHNNLSNYVNSKEKSLMLLEETGIPSNTRAEQLPIKDFIKLFKNIK